MTTSASVLFSISLTARAMASLAALSNLPAFIAGDDTGSQRSRCKRPSKSLGRRQLKTVTIRSSSFEAAERVGFVIVNVKDSEQLRDHQKVLDLVGQV